MGSSWECKGDSCANMFGDFKQRITQAPTAQGDAPSGTLQKSKMVVGGKTYEMVSNDAVTNPYLWSTYCEVMVNGTRVPTKCLWDANYVKQNFDGFKQFATPKNAYPPQYGLNKTFGQFKNWMDWSLKYNQLFDWQRGWAVCPVITTRPPNDQGI